MEYTLIYLKQSKNKDKNVYSLYFPKKQSRGRFLRLIRAGKASLVDSYCFFKNAKKDMDRAMKR